MKVAVAKLYIRRHRGFSSVSLLGWRVGIACPLGFPQQRQTDAIYFFTQLIVNVLLKTRCNEHFSSKGSVQIPILTSSRGTWIIVSEEYGKTASLFVHSFLILAAYLLLTCCILAAYLLHTCSILAVYLLHTSSKHRASR